MLTLFRHAVEAASGSEGFPLPRPHASLCRLATGRSALLHLIQRLPSSCAKTVLLPAYVAEGVIQPFLAAGFAIVFYRLQPDLRPDVDDVAALLQQAGARTVMVLIHYFGFSARSEALSSVLSRHDAIVVDDLAHAPFTVVNGSLLGEGADLALYSLNKFLPVVDGAILLSRRTDIDVAIDEEALPELPDGAQAAYRSHLQAAAELSACDDPAQARQALQVLGATYERYYAVINGDLSPHRQSAASRQAEASFPYRPLIEQRQANSRILYEGLKSKAFTLVYPKLPAGAVPFCVPARVAAERRDEILERLFAGGILLSTLQDKWDFIPADRQAHFAVESAFLREHVLIPVSEFISADAMWYIVEQLNLI